jgi:hypothetical protein
MELRGSSGRSWPRQTNGKLTYNMISFIVDRVPGFPFPPFQLDENEAFIPGKSLDALVLVLGVGVLEKRDSWATVLRD